MKTTKAQRIRALKASIKHWTEDYPKHCNFRNGEGFSTRWAPYADKCELCYLHDSVGSCNECPLVDYHDFHTREPKGCSRRSEWGLAVRAAEEGDRAVFMQHRRNLIRRMQRALKRERQP